MAASEVDVARHHADVPPPRSPELRRIEASEPPPVFAPRERHLDVRLALWSRRRTRDPDDLKLMRQCIPERDISQRGRRPSKPMRCSSATMRRSRRAGVSGIARTRARSRRSRSLAPMSGEVARRATASSIASAAVGSGPSGSTRSAAKNAAGAPSTRQSPSIGYTVWSVAPRGSRTQRGRAVEGGSPGRRATEGKVAPPSAPTSETRRSSSKQTQPTWRTSSPTRVSIRSRSQRGSPAASRASGVSRGRCGVATAGGRSTRRPSTAESPATWKIAPPEASVGASRGASAGVRAARPVRRSMETGTIFPPTRRIAASESSWRSGSWRSDASIATRQRPSRSNTRSSGVRRAYVATSRATTR